MILGAASRVFAAAIVIALAAGGLRADAAEIPAAERKSGFDYMAPEIQAMQREDTANPGMFAVLDGEALWNATPAAGQQSCAGCHGDARVSMRGVATRYPAYSEALARPIDLAGRINHCRQERQKQPPLRAESKDLLALTTFVAHQSRGMPVALNDDPRLAAAREVGRQLYSTRMGQLNFACSQCHDDNAGKRLGGSVIPQAHPNGYPLYRLEWQAVGSLQRRLRNCLTGVRAEPFAYGAPELIALELYLQGRAAGLPVETPAVRP